MMQQQQQQVAEKRKIEAKQKLRNTIYYWREKLDFSFMHIITKQFH